MAGSNSKKTGSAPGKSKPSSGPGPDKPAEASTGGSAFKLNDQDVEKYLASGEHGGLLEDYFGEDAYHELSRLAQ